MKKLFVLFFLAIALQVSAQQIKKLPYRTTRTLTADLNSDGKIDTIKLISSLEDRNSFNRISISLTGYQKKVFNARDCWTAVDSEFLAANKNTIHTKLLFLKKTDKHAVILLFGEMDGAGYRGEFSIINIENNNVKMPFDALNNNNNELDVEWPVTLTDIEHNGRLCFIYKTLTEFYGQGKNGNIGTYTPYFVYPVNDACTLDKDLMKKYNQQHYVFAGYDSNEKIKIFYPEKSGKPRIWKK